MFEKIKNLVNKKSVSLLFCHTYYVYIYKMLTRRKESNTYLATDSRHRRRTQIVMKVDQVCSFQPALWPPSAEEEESSSMDEGCSAD